MSITVSLFTPATKLGDIVAAQPSLARVFERLGLDYCCGGKQTLSAACSRKHLDPQTVAVMLEVAAEAVRSGPTEVDAARLTLTDLADHIEQTHHTYLKAELPRLAEMAGRVARKHGGRDARLEEVNDSVAALTQEMLSHMHKEEAVLFRSSGRSTPE